MPSNFKKPDNKNFRRGPKPPFGQKPVAGAKPLGGPKPVVGAKPMTGPKPAGGGPRPAGSRFGGSGPRTFKPRYSGSRGGSRSPANSQPPDNTPVPEGLVYYCKTCEQIVDFKPTTFNFKYPIENCQKDKAKGDDEKKKEMICDIAYGSERSIKHYYKIKDDKFDAERREREEKAQRADKF